MVELVAHPPIADLPITCGTVEIALLDTGALTSLAPYKGKEAACAKALGANLPKPGRSDAKLVWFSQGQWMLIGADAPDALAGDAALTDQTDAWCALQIKGADAQDVLARLVPIDLRPATFKRGHCARTQLGHMNVHITRLGKNAFRIMGFRSMAHTMVHELSEAARNVAARG